MTLLSTSFTSCFCFLLERERKGGILAQTELLTATKLQSTRKFSHLFPSQQPTATSHLPIAQPVPNKTDNWQPILIPAGQAPQRLAGDATFDWDKSNKELHDLAWFPKTVLNSGDGNFIYFCQERLDSMTSRYTLIACKQVMLVNMH